MLTSYGMFVLYVKEKMLAAPLPVTIAIDKSSLIFKMFIVLGVGESYFENTSKKLS